MDKITEDEILNELKEMERKVQLGNLDPKETKARLVKLYKQLSFQFYDSLTLEQRIERDLMKSLKKIANHSISGPGHWKPRMSSKLSKTIEYIEAPYNADEQYEIWKKWAKEDYQG